jgi:subtilisin family serine protease
MEGSKMKGITGKKIKNFRRDLKLNQPGFAKYLSKLTGEFIDSITVCRMEKFGARGACHPLPPSNAVTQIIDPDYWDHNAYHSFPKVEAVDILLFTGHHTHNSLIDKPLGDYKMKRNYYIRNNLYEVEQIDGIKAVKISSSDELGKVSRVSSDRLQVSKEHLQVFQDSGWEFMENSVSSPQNHEVSNAGTVFRRPKERTLMIGTNELTVKLKPEITELNAEERLRAEGVSIKRRLKFAPNLFVVNISAETDLLKIAEKLQKDKDFVYAEPVLLEYISNRESPLSYFIPPEDPRYGEQWQWRNDGTNGSVENADIRAELAWGHASGKNIRIAIIDFGFDIEHEDLRDGIDPESGYFEDNGDFVLGLTNYQNHAHGTFCAGLAGARMNKVGGCGIAFESKLLLISFKEEPKKLNKKLKGRVSSQRLLADAIGYAIDADVISCSLGLNVPMDGVLKDAISFAAQGRRGLGTPIFWATSNSNVPVSDDQVCCHPEVIAVGRSNSKDMSDGTAYGRELDFLAPGVDVFSTCPGNNYGVETGTSYATPIAAGVAALLLSIRSDLTSDQIRQTMRDSCDQVGGVQYINGHNEFYGYGRINAARAINSILSPTRTNLSTLSLCLMSSVIMMCFTMFAIT